MTGGVGCIRRVEKKYHELQTVETRYGNAVEASACKADLGGFESHRHLQKYSLLLDVERESRLFRGPHL